MALICVKDRGRDKQPKIAAPITPPIGTRKITSPLLFTKFTVVTPRLLRRVAGERFFGRGEAYFAEGAVRSLRRDGGGVKAAPILAA